MSFKTTNRFIIHFFLSLVIFIFFSACTFTSNNTKKDEAPGLPSDPYNRTIGSIYNTYIIHNFIGKEPDIISSTAKADVKRYLELAIDYLQNQFDDFYQSVSDRAGVKRYFAQFNLDFSDMPREGRHHHKHPLSECEQVDYYINKISEVCEPVKVDIIQNLSRAEESEAFILCFRVLINEAYKEGLGNNINSNSDMMKKYTQERAEISLLWNENNFLKSFSLDKDLDNSLESQRCHRIADKLYTLLHNATINMQASNTILAELSMKDLQYFITLALNIGSLTAMHDCATLFLNHDVCSI